MTVAEQDQEHLVPRRGAPTKYPWDLWMNGAIHAIAKGVEYDVSTKSMRTQLHVKAWQAGIKVTTQTDNDSITFQFTSEAPER